MCEELSKLWGRGYIELLSHALSSFLLKMEYVVDMQGFLQPGNDYVLKELAIVSLNDDVEPIVILFKEPFPWNRLTEKYKKQNTWLERHYHGISWTAGEKPYNTIGAILRESLYNVSKVWVSGSIQKKWLERFKFKVQDISEMGYPPLHKIKLATVCPHHNGAYRANCALHNVRLLKKFFIDSSEPLVPQAMDYL